MNKILTYLFLLYAAVGVAQIAHYNQFPAMAPIRILDDIDLNENIAFAYSLRLLRTDYEGPLVELRRDDGLTMDFSCGGDDRVDIEAIDTWRAGQDVFIRTWYDQSEEGRDAIQTIDNRQPEFFTDVVQPYWVGDGSNDILLVEDTFAQVTDNGARAAIAGIFWASDRADTAFGGAGGCSNRWISHINWSDNFLYFDPAYCGPTRRVSNLEPTVDPNGRLETWGQYSLIRRDNPASTTNDRIVFRIQGTERANANINASRQYSQLTRPFGIGAATNNNAGTAVSASTTRFSEMIMYNRGKEDIFIQEIEENQIAFWNL